MSWLAGVVTVGLLWCAASPVAAQYFGRNKVQYQRFDFQVLKTEHFDIYFYPSERTAAELAGRMAERWYVRLSSVLEHTLSGRQPLILYASAPQFRQTNAIPGELGEGTGGVTESQRRRIVLPTGGTLNDLNHVIGHELVHAFQYDMAGGGATPGIASLPLWFVEGMAEYLSIGPVAQQTAMWMRGAIMDIGRDSLPTFRQLEDPRFFPYRYGHALLAYIAGRWGDQSMSLLLRSAARRRDIGSAMMSVLGMHPDTVVANWHAETRATFAPLLEVTQPADTFGRRVIAADATRSPYNVGPSLSPDGSQLMFLSNRNLFSIDLFLADVRTGEVKKQVTKTAVSPHFQSLQFIQSSGSWSPDGRRFVFAGLSSGRPVLAVYNVAKHRMEREIRFEQLEEILTPSWSPDGRRMAFSALTGGFSDLYVYDLETEQLTRLTDDSFAALQPVWSPDGQRIAFATDRFTTNLDSLSIGPYRLAMVDLRTKVMRPLPTLPGVRQFNPQWAPDGKSLYFISDPGGIPNVYRLHLGSHQISQVTNLFTGVSGITETSPALTVAAQSGQLVFNVFRANGLELYVIDSATVLAGRPIAEQPPVMDAAVLPPAERERAQLGEFLAKPAVGLPRTSTYTFERYRAGLALTSIGMPTLVAGSNQFGTFLGGGVVLTFSDMLGNRNLITGLQVYGSLKDLSAIVAYQNLARRVNWGLVAEQLSFRSGGFAQGVAEVDGQPVLVQQEVIDRQINRDVYGVLAYPFNEVRRVEVSLGYSNITFDREIRTVGFSAGTGQQIVDNRRTLPAGAALNLVSSRVAYVYDNAFFGATSPILGQRFRFELGGDGGSLNFGTVVADFRRYLMPVRPVTFALRLLHSGRYGRDGEDPRLQELFLGYPGLVRGYGYYSFNASECHPPPNQPLTCPVFDQLLGSKIVVAGAELRFPLLGVLGIGSGYYGALPIEFFMFGEAGLAWDSANEPKVFGIDGVRKPVRSVGVGFRMNLFGLAIAEVDFVRPFDRPAKDWIWQFELSPGF